MTSARTAARRARAPGAPGGPPLAGFTLIETALATVIIGVGVVALVEAQQSFQASNAWSSQAATATLLANEIREMTRTFPRHDPVTGLYLLDDALQGWGIEDGEVEPGDLDDVDDFDGLTFGTGGDFEGPIDAFGDVIPQLAADGSLVLDDEGNPLPLQGWRQAVTVEKLDPFNTALVRADDYADAPLGEFAGRDVDDFPLRVTVVVTYQGPFDAEPAEVTRVVWIVPQTQ